MLMSANELPTGDFKNRLNPLNDYLFMKYMGEKGDEEQLAAFLNVVLQKTGKNRIKSVAILEDRRLSAAIVDGKAGELDVRAEMDDGSVVDIEVQLRNVGNMDRRSLFYWSREYARHIEAGDDYTSLPNVIAINILGAEFLSVDEVHASFHLWEDTHKNYMLTDALEMHFIDMVKFGQLKERDIEHNALHRWLAFFDKKTDSKTLKKIIAMDPAIKQAHDKIMFVAQDKEALRIYQMREKAVYDYNNGMRTAEQRGMAIGEQRGIAIGEQRGIAIGEERGMQKGKYQIALNLQHMGFSLEEIAKCAMLTTEEVAAILKEQGLA